MHAGADLGRHPGNRQLPAARASDRRAGIIGPRYTLLAEVDATMGNEQDRAARASATVLFNRGWRSSEPTPDARPGCRSTSAGAQLAGSGSGKLMVDSPMERHGAGPLEGPAALHQAVPLCGLLAWMSGRKINIATTGGSTKTAVPKRM